MSLCQFLVFLGFTSVGISRRVLSCWAGGLVLCHIFGEGKSGTPNKAPHPTAARPSSCQHHRKSRRPTRSGCLPPAAVGESLTTRATTPFKRPQFISKSIFWSAVLTSGLFGWKCGIHFTVPITSIAPSYFSYWSLTLLLGQLLTSMICFYLALSRCSVWFGGEAGAQAGDYVSRGERSCWNVALGLSSSRLF